MTRPSIIGSCLTAAIWACLAVGCGGLAPGWQRLWPGEWELEHVGVTWVAGVSAADRVVSVPTLGAELRTELANRGDRPATVELHGPERVFRWSLAVAETKPIAVPLPPGDWRFEIDGEVVLGSPRVGRPLPEARLLLVILVDTLRADHVTPALMPGVHAAFDGGRRWTGAQANAPWTLPSVVSLFTGRPVLDMTSPEGDIVGVPSGCASWATVLSAAGFEGGAVVANPTVHALNGFAGGFSTFVVPDGGDVATAPDGRWVVDRARDWLAAHTGEDAFLYLHLMDPHEPYRDHAGDGSVLEPLRSLALGRHVPGADEVATLRRRYAGEVRHTDEVLTPFLAELPMHAAVVLTADHGEALGEHGAWAHGLNLYREALDVPLMARAPGLSPEVVTIPVQLLDLAPTLLDLAGVASDSAMVGRSLLDGGSDLPMVGATFSAGPLRWSWRDGDRKVVLRMAAQPGLGAESRQQLASNAPLPSGGFLFDLAQDPSEDRPGVVPEDVGDEVGRVFAATAGRMVPGLQLLIKGGGGPVAAEVAIDREVEVVQAWSGGPVEVDRSAGRLVLRCSDADPLCAVAFAAGSIPAEVTPLSGAAEWRGVAADRPVDVRQLDAPDAVVRGAYLWWNPDRPLVVGGYDETMERLRALGYIE
ncbi:MAG: sulfatase [Holophagae bacterium]